MSAAATRRGAWCAPGTLRLLALLALLGGAIVGCGGGAATADPSEAFPGGDATVFRLFAGQQFGQPAPNLTEAHNATFFTGNSFFNKVWVTAPASTTARDGLGPTFNARSCSGCHFRDGRGRPPDDGGEMDSMLLRVSLAGDGGQAGVGHVPGYGDQIEPHGIDGVPGEATVRVRWVERPGRYGDGTPYSLREPVYALANPAFGPLGDDVLKSGRVAPAMIGLGLLEAIPEQTLLAWADPDDADGDGISGRVNRVWDVEARQTRAGRFGWKAGLPSVRQQVGGAFVGDMGITSPLFPEQNCPTPQSLCAAAPSGGEPEIPEDRFAAVVLYAETLAPPTRPDYADPEVMHGRDLFADIGCTGCHKARVETGAFPALPEMAHQKIQPYTDLLLHDMGPGLADDRPEFLATGSEWRTPPLWGIGRVQTVNDHSFFLHDGRARGFAEAILWHGGEAQAARDAFASLPAADRDTVVRFLRSL